ncbi:MAG: hypothetical protein QM610_13805 [Chitinophagaceae bacterium]
MRKYGVLLIVGLLCLLQSVSAQNGNDWKLDVQQLKTSASLLFIGVTPNDYNKQLAQYFLHHNLYRVGFLSLTRGENTDLDSIAYPLQPMQRGIYHVNKAVSEINQCYSDLYCTRAYDFLSNEREDSTAVFEKLWDWRTIVGDIVWDIRTFCPDVIIVPSYSHLNQRGKRFYSLRMVQDAIRIAADSAYFKEQFDDSRYPWKAIRVLSLDALAGKLDFAINDSLNIKYNLLAGRPFQNSIMDGVDTSWDRIYNGSDNGRFDKYLDSIKSLNFPGLQQAKSLLALRHALDTTNYFNSLWREYKDGQLNNLLLKYAGIKMSIDFGQPFLVLGKPYRYRINYDGDTSIFKLKHIRFGRFDTSFNTIATKYAIVKDLVFSSKETPYQPYWLSSAMGSDGMYEIGSRAYLNSPTDYNIFNGTFRFLADGFFIDYNVFAHYPKPQDSVREMPIITLPGFSNIAPGVVLTHLQPSRKNETIYVQLQPNFTEKQVPITIDMMRKGVVIRNNQGFKSGRSKLLLATKDTVADLNNGKSLDWTFDIPKTVLDSLDGDIGAEIWLGKDKNKLKINSGLAHIALPGLSDINYHFQSGIRLLSADTFIVEQKNPIALLTDSSGNPAVQLFKMILHSLHIDYKMLDIGKLFLNDSLSSYSTLVIASKVPSDKDSVLSQYVSNGGRLIVLPFRNDSLPLFIKDSVGMRHDNLIAVSGLKIEASDSSALLMMPNKISFGQYPDKDIISTCNWHWKGLQNTDVPFRYMMNGDTIAPLLFYRYGKGSIALNAFFLDAETLEKPFVYKLWANLLKEE